MIDLSKYYNKLEYLKSSREELSNSITLVNSKIDNISEEIRIFNESYAVVVKMIEDFSNDSLNRLQSLINQALSLIFYDRNYSIKFEVSDTKNKKLEMLLVEGDIESVIPEGIGGGVLTVISFIIHIYLIKEYDLDRIVFLDEQFTQISSDYIDRFFYFLREVSKQMDFKFILITQDERIPLELFDDVYYVEMGKIKKL